MRSTQPSQVTAAWVNSPIVLQAPTVPVPESKLLDPVQIEAGLVGSPLVNVIVNLAAPTLPPRTLHQRITRRVKRGVDPEIHEAQQEVLDSLPQHELKLRKRFQNFPSFSAAVSLSGLRALQAHPRVCSIEPVYTLEPHMAQGIPLMGGMPYRAAHNGAGVAIAICDTGIDYSHPLLGGGSFPNSKVIGGYDFGDNDADPLPQGQPHGTACAGVAAGGLASVGDYIGGVANNAKLYALKITSGGASSATSDALVAAWDWCVTHQYDDPEHPILVISTSFGGGRFSEACNLEVPSLTASAANAVAAGITILASSGNEGYCDAIDWPACLSDVLAIGAVYDAPFGSFAVCVDGSSCAPKTPITGCASGWYCEDATGADVVAAYSNSAETLALLAPANSCSTLDLTGSAGYSAGDYLASFGGTSSACPYAAGAVASLQSAAMALTGHFLTVAEVKECLAASGDPIEDLKSGLIRPRIHLGRAIEMLPSAGQSFHIFNDGAAALTVLGIAKETPAPWIRVFPAEPFTLLPGGRQDVTVTVDFFQAPAVTTTTRLLVTSSDASKNPYPSGVNVVVDGYSTIVGRHIFYNGSAFDGGDPAANEQDDGAIAPDKTALRPGGKATFANYTSYALGINGVMLDIADLPATPEAGDFDFQMSNNEQPVGWIPAPAPASVTVRPSSGIGGSKRITLTWPARAIQKRWLRVTVKASPTTGLAADDVFYFGNAIGETGNNPADAKVDSADQLGVRSHPRSFIDPAPIDFIYDMDRDKRVDSTDQLLTRANQTSFINALPMLDLTGTEN